MRDNKIDVLKGALIITVIIGHCLELNLKNQTCLAIYCTIYAFHMPLFVFVSGYLSQRYEDKRLFVVKILRILETLIVFHFAFNIRNIIIGDIDFFVLFCPFWILWYLLSLVFWKALIQFTPPNIQALSR